MPDVVTLDDIKILDVGNTIQLGGAVWTGNDRVYIVPLPDEELSGAWCVLQMDTAQWERFLFQTDVLDVRGPGKAVLRKSQRQIDQWIAWAVFRRDGFLCRYCGAAAPLTVDHIIRWEDGGPTVEDNLVSACRNCNKTRGNMDYAAWMTSEKYGKLSDGLTAKVHVLNLSLVGELERLKQIVAKPRSR